jgi:hypothetical protein
MALRARLTIRILLGPTEIRLGEAVPPSLEGTDGLRMVTQVGLQNYPS